MSFKSLIFSALLVALSACHVAAQIEYNIRYVDEPLSHVVQSNLVGLDLGLTQVTSVKFQDEELEKLMVNFEAYFAPQLKEALVRTILNKYGIAHFVDRKTGEAFIYRMPAVQGINLYYSDEYDIEDVSKSSSSISNVSIVDSKAYAILPDRLFKGIQFAEIPELQELHVDQALAKVDFLFVFTIDDRKYAYGVSRAGEGWMTGGGEMNCSESLGISYLNFLKYMPEYLSDYLSPKS